MVSTSSTLEVATVDRFNLAAAFAQMGERDPALDLLAITLRDAAHLITGQEGGTPNVTRS